MKSKQRLLAAIDGNIPDRLPCTTHELIPYYLKNDLNGISEAEFFESFQLDKTVWLNPLKAQSEAGQTLITAHDIYQPFVETDTWKLDVENIHQSGRLGKRFTIITPQKSLTMVLEYNKYTSWVSEHLIKDPMDIDFIALYAPNQSCDNEAVRTAAAAAGDNALIRGMIPGFDIYGQPGCWQDAACMFGIEDLIYKTFDDPSWVNSFLSILQKRKLAYLDTMRESVCDSHSVAEGVCEGGYDIVELGGGDASTTVISPDIFRKFVAPFDEPIVEKAISQKLRVTYHTCGGMMPILEDIADLGVTAVETLTPIGMGGDANLAEAKRRIGDRVCLIGGFDQGHFFTNATEAEVEAEVLRCFRDAGEQGGFILTPSDHFFKANPNLLHAFSAAAKKCRY